GNGAQPPDLGQAPAGVPVHVPHGRHHAGNARHYDLGRRHCRKPAIRPPRTTSAVFSWRSPVPTSVNPKGNIGFLFINASPMVPPHFYAKKSCPPCWFAPPVLKTRP